MNIDIVGILFGVVIGAGAVWGGMVYQYRDMEGDDRRKMSLWDRMHRHDWEGNE